MKNMSEKISDTDIKEKLVALNLIDERCNNPRKNWTIVVLNAIMQGATIRIANKGYIVRVDITCNHNTFTCESDDIGYAVCCACIKAFGK